jgi:hypothetical protein
MNSVTDSAMKNWTGDSMDKEMEKTLTLVFDTARDYAERTGYSFWELSPTEQRKEIENYYEDHQ